MPNLGSSLRGTPLKTERDRYGVKFSLFPAREWEISGYAHEDKKDGTRDVGATFGFASASILPVPFTYKTDNFGLSLGYRGKRLQYNIAYTGSLFTSDEHSITWSNPYSTPAGVGSGLMAEAPDNQFHKISGRLGYQLTERTRIGGELAYGRMTQNEGFLPYTSNAAISVPALPASSLDAVVDTTLAKLDVNSRPTPRLRINASYTYSNRDNKTPVNNYNYVITDSSLAIDPNTGQPVVRQNRPYGFKQQLLRTNVGYLLPKHMDVSGGFDYDQMNRTYVLVKDTTDKTLWAKLKARPSEKFEGSLKYSYSKRDASSPIVSSATAAYQNPVYPESGVGIASMNPLMLAFNLADRTRNKLGVELALTPKDNLSADLSLDYYKDDYSNMALGLNQAKGLTITPTLTYMFSDKLSGAAYYTYEKLSSDQTSNQWIATPYLSTIWMESDSNVTQTFGLNMNWKAIPDKLDLGADAAYSTFTGKIGYSSGADLPNLDSTLTALGLHGNYKLKDHLSLRGGLWYEKYKESDWAKYPSVNLLPTLLSLGTAPQDLDTYLLSIMLRYDMK
jgi:MtrB/PioB family decaheme-associated outer membrane protein